MNTDQTTEMPIKDQLSELRGFDGELTASALLRVEASKEGFTKDVTGDVCVGDEIIFLTAEFNGSFRNAKFAGYKIWKGVICRDSYGAEKQQHTFTVTLESGAEKRIKGRNLYKIGVFAKPRQAEERAKSLELKHLRGEEARRARQLRVASYN